MWNRLSVGRSLIARSARKYTRPSESTGRSWGNAYRQTAAHGPELHCLTSYCGLLLLFGLGWEVLSLMTRNEFSVFPYMNKDRHVMYDKGTRWEDPRSQRNICYTHFAPNFFNESTCKNYVKELLNEIHE